MAQDELPNSLARQLEQLRASIRGSSSSAGAAAPSMKAQTPTAGPHVHFGPTTVRPIPASASASSLANGGFKGSLKKYGKILVIVVVIALVIVIYIKLRKRPKRPVPTPPIPPPRPSQPLPPAPPPVHVPVAPPPAPKPQAPVGAPARTEMDPNFTPLT
jgi:hypothetical protein